METDLFPPAGDGDFLADMGKEDLAAYAQQMHGLKLDLSKSLKSLLAQVRALEGGATIVMEPPETEKKALSEWYRNVKTGQVWPARAEVIGNERWAPCREDGT